MLPSTGKPMSSINHRDRQPLDVDRRVVPSRAARVEGRRQEVGHDPHRRRRRVDPAEEPRVAVSHRVGEDLSPDEVEQRLGHHAHLGQRSLEERRPLRRRHGREDGTLADPAEVIGHQVDGGVGEPPELGRIHRQRRRRSLRAGRGGCHGRLLPAGWPVGWPPPIWARLRRAWGPVPASSMAR